MNKPEEKPITLRELITEEPSTTKPEIPYPVAKMNRYVLDLLKILMPDKEIPSYVPRQSIINLLGRGITADTTLEKLAAEARKEYANDHADRLDILIEKIRARIMEKRAGQA